MTKVDEFDAFYDGTRRHVLHLAYAFTGDLTAAAAATQDAYASAWQHWSKLRRDDPLETVRPESLRVAALRHGAHLVRRKPPPEADGELIAALRTLPGNARRLVLLQTIGDVDLGRAARETGVTDEEAVRLTDTAVASLEEHLGTSIGEVERRLHAMHGMTDATPLPRASIIRRTGGRRHRRNTAVAVVAAAAVLLGGGYLVTEDDGTTPPRQHVGDPVTATPTPTGPVVEVDQLLDEASVAGLGRGVTWRETGTSDALTDQEPLTTCAQGRFASQRLRQGLTRTFRGDQMRSEVAVQTVELTRSSKAAERAYDAQLGWYSGCQEPRVQLMESYRIPRTEGDTTVLVLRQWTDPVRTMTVGVGRTGSAATTVVHQAEGGRPVDLEAFSETMDQALGRLCVSVDGTCEVSAEARPTAPPSTGEGTGFLGVVDLPPVANLAKVWGGTQPLRWRPRPPATPCEAADFSEGADLARSRDYVVPEAEQVPLTFGISETIARFGSGRAARAFVERTEQLVARCDEQNLGADVSDPTRVRRGDVSATVWQMSFSLADDDAVTYRMGMVVNRDRVAQVTFSPVGRYDIDGRAYERLLLRAGQRLAELPED
jgi:DNA-directed RNA polymerase specialized sigma24 family protein